MSCETGRGIDLEGYLVEPTAPEWDAFRAHHPTCTECSARVASAFRLEGLLRAALATHPEEAALLAFRRSAEALEPPEREAIREHLGACAICRDALTAVASLDLARPLEVQGAPARSDVPAGSWHRLLSPLREALSPLPLWVPATALAAVVVLALFWSSELAWIGEERPVLVAEREDVGEGDSPESRVPGETPAPGVDPDSSLQEHLAALPTRDEQPAATAKESSREDVVAASPKPLEQPEGRRCSRRRAG